MMRAILLFVENTGNILKQGFCRQSELYLIFTDEFFMTSGNTSCNFY